MREYTIQTISALIGGICSFIFGNLDAFFMVLVALEVIDFVAGISLAFVKKNVNSERCFAGLLKKIFILMMVALGQLIDTATAQDICRNVIIFFYIANEAMSIVENAGKAGLPVPEKIVNALEQLKEK